ncbi:MAG: hypothetical protein IJL48_07080 [Bacteroidales bacterium]|nr:hypothetical protein [Bacteroidales bacterium]
MARKIKKWSEMLEEIQSRRSRVYREGCKFVYDSGDLPDGLIGVAPGTVLALQRPHGITALQMPGNAEDWIVIGGGSGGGGGVSITIDSSLSSSSTNPVQNKAVKAALDEKMPADQAFKTINGQSIKGSGNITPDSSLSSSSTNPVQNKAIKAALDSKVDKVSGKGLSTNDFTTELKNKLSALPVISISGNTLTIDGRQFTLTPAGGGDVLEESVYYGFIPASVTGFNSLASALVTSISPQHVKTAIANGTIVKASNLPITDSNAPTVTTNGKYAYFLALVPQNQNYAVKAWNGINAYDPFDNQQDHYANGDLTLSVDGISYKVYADYAATSGTEYKITIE